ncbi:hypothetical protein RND81_06G115200 [Saponaria officinalis]|uniref:Retrotransposon Copia-like N-terminal domain-containing protein n=1 Tax=Saponaria officinalis TaxID=3572 RepID=A0AAW1K9E5_SAPOF
MVDGNNDGSKGKSKPQLIHDPGSIYYLHPSETGSSLTKSLLSDSNYDIWEKAVTNALEGRNKFGFINGEFKRPTDEKSAEFLAWKSNNSTICSWIFNLVDDELYGSEDLTCGCTCATTPKLRARVEESKTHDFLMGLDDDQFGTLRSQILSMDHFPTLNKVFSLVTQEERHKSIVRARDDITEAMSFASSSSNPTIASFLSGTRPKCTYCDRLGHTYVNCFQRLGYPPGFARGRGGRTAGCGAHGWGCGGGRSSGAGCDRTTAAPSSIPSQQQQGTAYATQTTLRSSDDTPPPPAGVLGLNADQMQKLLTLLDSPPSSEPLSGMAHSLTWMLDSGASHHMTGEKSVLYNVVAITPTPVTFPNVSHTMATMQGSVDLNFCFVLHNDRTTRRVIGLGKFQHGVFVFKPVPKQALSFSTSVDN